tara:strand:- start:198 stop:557 length:360 start_codon:yes stop_codon:yes gene_type:complete
MPFSREKLRKRRQLRVRNRLRKYSTGRLRLSVFKSSKNIYAQIIDDNKGNTLVSVSTLEKSLGFVGKNNIDAAKVVGSEIGNRAKKAGVEEVYFDRGSFIYHGKVKALADAAREAGLKF